MDANFNRLSSTYRDLKSLLPNVLGKSLPSALDSLGKFTITGKSLVTSKTVNADIQIDTKLGYIISNLEMTKIDDIDTFLPQPLRLLHNRHGWRRGDAGHPFGKLHHCKSSSIRCLQLRNYRAYWEIEASSGCSEGSSYSPLKITLPRKRSNAVKSESPGSSLRTRQSRFSFASRSSI